MSYTGLSKERVVNQYVLGQIRYQYSKDGLFLTSTSFHDVDGELINEPEFGFAKTRMTRDSRGLLSKLEYLDVKGALVNRRDSGVASMSYVYNEQGVRIATERFDALGKAVAMR